MSRYLICAMPRRGSAWLANFLTADNCLCIHEPLAYRREPPTGYRVLGGADTGAAWMLDAVRQQVPDMRFYALTRNIDDARASAARLGFTVFPDWPALDLPTFEYARLFDVGYLRELWTELNGPGFDAYRAQELIEMNVQHDIARLAARMQDRGERARARALGAGGRARRRIPYRRREARRSEVLDEGIALGFCGSARALRKAWPDPSVNMFPIQLL